MSNETGNIKKANLILDFSQDSSTCGREKNLKMSGSERAFYVRSFCR